ncbi:MAG TPA: polyphosphate polymerase domain-containing protein [Bacteroidetes bacterium]|nr:polyphosphate polymerase domain-containing protein [Bacteroidota bacterium]
MRYERKYRIEAMDHHAVRAIVDGHPVSFRKLFPDRQVNNIYLDTRDMSFFRENLSGLAQRRKYRVRWYGADLLNISAPILEIKIKDTELGEKVSAPLPDFSMGSFTPLREAVGQRLRELAEAAPALAFPAVASVEESADIQRVPFPVQDLVPSLLNTYKRAYLISNDGRFRLTIDREMRFYGINHHFRPYRNFSPDHAVVVEVKYEAEHDQFYDGIGQYLPFRLGKNSKYVNGVLLTGNV